MGTPPQGPAKELTATPALAVTAVSNELNPRLLRRFKPLRQVLSLEGPGSAAVVDLGRILDYEPRLAESRAVSCNSCHPLASYGATQDATSTGVHGKQGSRNAPTTYNAAGHFAQFWDGRLPDVEDQAKRPIVNPVEMGMPAAAVVAVLEAIPGYVAAFRRPSAGIHHPADPAKGCRGSEVRFECRSLRRSLSALITLLALSIVVVTCRLPQPADSKRSHDAQRAEPSDPGHR